MTETRLVRLVEKCLNSFVFDVAFELVEMILKTKLCQLSGNSFCIDSVLCFLCFKKQEQNKNFTSSFGEKQPYPFM